MTRLTGMRGIHWYSPDQEVSAINMFFPDCSRWYLNDVTVMALGMTVRGFHNTKQGDGKIFPQPTVPSISLFAVTLHTYSSLL